jgi:enediyne biosynthesis protein E4
VALPRWLALTALGTALAVLLGSPLLADGWQRASTPQSHPSTPLGLAPAFRDVARERGIAFVHLNGASPEKFFPEIMGSGGLFLDFDNDGWLDLFLVDGGSFADPAAARRARHRLYRNRGASAGATQASSTGSGRARSTGAAQAPSTSSSGQAGPTGGGQFEDVTAASGIEHRDYGMGACAGDIDNDGLIDLYVTAAGRNQLFRNTGNGRFAEVAKAGGAEGGTWSTSCAFVDVDRDGYLDLFVTNYVDVQRGKNEFCGVAGPPAIRDYCHPLIYPPLTSALYRNTGRGTFDDISATSGVAGHRGNGLGVAVTDIDSDGWPDVFVANDSMPNFLFRNEHDGTFTEIAELAGVAVASDGKARAGMGTAFADFSDSGRPGLVVTNHETEMHSLFENLGGRLFSDVTVRSGVGPVTRPYVGFGVAFVDYDNDTHLDLAIVNGHVMANAAVLRAGAKYAQRNLLLRNTGGRFADMKERAGPGFAPELVSRALAAGDIDNDGDEDLLITNNGGPANLLLNEGRPAGANALLVRAIGGKSNRSAIGARLVLTLGQRRLMREVRSGSSYLAQNDLRVHFGLGPAPRADKLEIRWPNGASETFAAVAANQIITIEEGKGIVNRTPLTAGGRGQGAGGSSGAESKE